MTALRQGATSNASSSKCKPPNSKLLKSKSGAGYAIVEPDGGRQASLVNSKCTVDSPCFVDLNSIEAVQRFSRTRVSQALQTCNDLFARI